MPKFEVKTKNGKSIFLKDEDEIHRGGEGRIILMSAKTGLVAKIYHLGINGIDEDRFNQLQTLDKELFVVPIDLLYQNQDIVGYTMEYAGKEFFPLSSLFSPNFNLRNSIDDSFKQKIAQKIIDAVKTAHFAGFVIGDLNQFNVLVNLNGEVKFIDVDSYETPGHLHNGMLLDDIRDYYYQGVVNMNSDYFALSVLLFSLFAYTHPFKGIHQKYKSLAERMIHKIPVFLDDPMLKLPKCYQPILHQPVQEEFNKLYLEGQRFLLSLNGVASLKINPKPKLIKLLDVDDLNINLIFENAKIKNVNFNQDLGYIETDEVFSVFKSLARGQLSKMLEINKNECSQVFLGTNNIFALKEQKLYFLNNINKPIEIQNFIIPDNSYFYQLENILIVICPGQMYLLYLDEVLNHSIRNKRIEIFSEAFSHHSGLIQNTGGVQRIFYNTGKDIATVKIPKPIKKIYQQRNVGIVQFIENKKVENQYFKISGLDFEFVDIKPETMIEFGYSNTSNTEGFIFEPDDNRLLIRRSGDFNVISEIKCNVSRQSCLFYSKSGIINWDSSEVHLINKKN